MRSVVRAGVCLTLCVVAGMSTAATAAHAARRAPSLKPLKVSIHFTKTRYTVHAKAHIVIILRNAGSHKLHAIGAACNRAGDPNQLNNRGHNWGRLAVSAAGVTLAAHRARTFHVTATVPAAAQRAGTIAVACDFGYRRVDGGYRPRVSDTAKVPGQSGALAGTIGYFVNGKSGATAGLKGVRVVLVDPTSCPLHKHTAITGVKGRFTFSHAPAGNTYKLYLRLPRGWKMRHAHSNPTNAIVLGKHTTGVYLEVKRGTPVHRPKLPAKCH